MNASHYNSVLNFIGEESYVVCCIRKRVGVDVFHRLLEEVNPSYYYSDVLADISQRGNLYFIKKSKTSRPNCLLVMPDFFPTDIPSNNVIILKKDEVAAMRDKKTAAKNGNGEVKTKKVSPQKALRKMNYDDFLKTDYWKSVRKEKLRQCGCKCQICGAKNNLHVHHNSYIHHGDEYNHLEDLIVLCKECHNLFHQKLHVTTINM